MAAFGAEVERLGEGRWRVRGRGGLAEPADVIDCGNSGTGVRLMHGRGGRASRSARRSPATPSLRGRPMMRVLRPLGEMGAGCLCREGGRLPLALKGGGLTAIAYRLPEPSAQVKSAVLLAGLNARGRDRGDRARGHPRPHRAHAARLRGRGRCRGRGRRAPHPPCRRPAARAAAPIRVPGDPSSAAFPLVAALITPGSEVTVEGVLLNPLRIGLFETLREMGADLVDRERARSRAASGWATSPPATRR